MITRDSEGQFRFHYDEDDNEVASALRQIFINTEVGRDYKANYNTNATGAADYTKILKAAVAIAGGPMITEGILLHALDLLIQSGELRPKKATPAAQLEEPEEDTRPRDKNGKLLTPQQIQWSSFRQFAETASMAEINRRKTSDPEFANFVRKNLEREMNQEIGDAVVPAGTPVKTSKANNELVDFVRRYNATPSDQLKPKGGFVVVGGEAMKYSDFQTTVNRAIEARLL